MTATSEGPSLMSLTRLRKSIPSDPSGFLSVFALALAGCSDQPISSPPATPVAGTAQRSVRVGTFPAESTDAGPEVVQACETDPLRTSVDKLLYLNGKGLRDRPTGELGGR